ncbi:MAG: hypothetical protein JXB47_13830 [Anaerolineae bacterium]|nr:hypothetical protein [Anaerolineae bacterium]
MQSRPSSQFWAIVLIGLGVVLLAGNILPNLSSGFLALFLILLGLYVLAGRDLLPQTEIKTDRFTAPVDAAASARIDIDLSVGDATVHALPEPGTLIDANLTYAGEIDFSVSGEAKKSVRLRQTRHSFAGWLDPSTWFGGSPERRLRWDVGLNADIPMDLNVQGGLGAARLDLRDLKVTDLRVGCGAGTVRATLPAVGEGYTAQLHGGAGALNIDIPEDAVLGTSVQGGIGSINIKIGAGAAVNAQIQGGMGSVNIDVPPDAAVRVEAQTGLGSISVPPHFSRLSGGQDGFIAQEGAWETPGFADAGRQINIAFNGGMGGFTVR